MSLESMARRMAAEDQARTEAGRNRYLQLLEGATRALQHPFHDWARRNDLVEDLGGAEYVVLLDRYENGLKWGVHALTRREEPHRCGPFRHRTIGLFRKAETEDDGPVTVDGLRDYLMSVHCLQPPVSLLGCDDPELFEYIGRQVIPIEWKSAWAEKDPHTIGLVQVMR